jgi:hypothetical protein
LKALSIRQPWAWAITHAGKDIENRTWATKFRGRMLIHAGKTVIEKDYDKCFDVIKDINRRETPPPILRTLRLGPFGGIVGECEIVDCLTQSDSPWFFGPYGFVLRNCQPLPFAPCKGKLGFFEVES